MTAYVIDPPPPVSLSVMNSQMRYPVHRVYCIGRNYADHAVEMGHDPSQEPPFFFQKNPDNLSESNLFPYPPGGHDVHHEVELMVALKSGGSNLSVDQAKEAVFGYGICLDMTLRDVQAQAKKLGQPWEPAKAFDSSAPCSGIKRAEEVHNITDGRIILRVNGNIRQSGKLNQMIWKIPEIIVRLSQLFTLRAGDVILTGTPAGVGAVVPGDQLKAAIDSIGELDVRVV